MPEEKWVHRGADEYARGFNALLPQGVAWPRDRSAVLQMLVNGLTQIWGDQVEELAATLLTRESDPRATVDLLLEWERAWGLPDPCLVGALTIDERRAVLVQKMTLLGAQSREFFIDFAAALGHDITITEYSPFVCGISRCGNTNFYNPDTPTENRWMLGQPENRFYWTVHVNTVRLSYFRTGGSQTGIDRLLRIGLAEDLECTLRRYKPAHTEIVFDYSPQRGMSALLAGTGNLSASTKAVYQSFARLSGSGALATTLTAVNKTSTTLAGAGALRNDVNIKGKWFADARLEGDGALSVNGVQRLLASAPLAGAGALTVDVDAIFKASVSFAGAGSLTALMPPPQRFGSALFSGAGALTAQATKFP